MPLIKSSSKDAVSENIRTEMSAAGGNKPQKQAVAIALETQRRARRGNRRRERGSR